MQSRWARTALPIAALVAIVVLFVVLSGGNDNKSTSTSRTQVLTIDKHGKPVGGVKKLTYKTGDQVRFAVKAGVTGDVHVHGYDIEKKVPVGKMVIFSFPARLEGVFDIESHIADQQIAELRVNP